MTIPVAFLDELRTRTTLSSIVSQTTPLKKAGREWKACCPFHQEKSPSFTVNDEKGFYHCFGCQAHGDAIRWLTDQRGLTFIDAVKDLAARAGMEVPAPDPRSAERERSRGTSVDTMARAQKWFAGWLAHDEHGAASRDYLAQRGIRPLTIERFGVGFAPSSGIGAAIREDGQTDEDLEKLGLIRINPDTGEVRDFFRRRIMIPIHDARGNVIAFGGRIIGSGEPKYLNSPDTPIFDKGRTLFNLHRAAVHARATGKLLIVEGYMDVIGVDSAGFEAAVAPNGTALTEAQLALAWRLVDSPVVCFDGDRAGRKAAVRAALRAIAVMEPGKTLRFAFPPDGQDPDDVARAGGLEAVNMLVDSARPLLDVIWHDLLERFDFRKPDSRAALSAEIKSLLKGIQNVDVRSAYRDAFRELYGAAGKRQGSVHHPRHDGLRRQGSSVADAVENTLALGVLGQLSRFDAWFETVDLLKWRDPDTKRLMGVLTSAYIDAGDAKVPFDADFAAKAIEAAGLSDHVANLRHGVVLRMPFLEETDIEAARPLLFDALRANFT